MNDDVTRILTAIAAGDELESEKLLPLVYDELRKLAAARLTKEKPGQTLQATALVHEAYIRLVDSDKVQHWNSRGHFFAAAAVAMRRILIENARRKRRVKHGGNHRRVNLDEALALSADSTPDLVALDDALARLEDLDPDAAIVVNLRYFAGLTMPQVAEAVGVSLRTVERNWTYARTWLHRELSETR